MHRWGSRGDGVDHPDNILRLFILRSFICFLPPKENRIQLLYHDGQTRHIDAAYAS